MAEQFRRAFRVQIGLFTFDSSPTRPLKFRFQIERDIKKPPNNASVQIYNLAEQTRSFLGAEKFVVCKIDVGYEDDLTQVFFGDLRRATSSKVGPDWVTQLDSGDGEKQLAQAQVNRTFRKGTDLRVVLSALGKSMGLGEGNLRQTSPAYPDGRTTLAANWTASGRAGDELEFFCRSVGIRWSVQDAQLMFLSQEKPAFATGPLISPTTGMINSPTLDSDGNVEVSSLMLPDLMPGRAFEVESRQVNGKFVATHTIHAGDSTGGDWFVKVKGSPLK